MPLQSLVNANVVYMNFTNTTFQKVPISHLTYAIKFVLRENIRSGYLVNMEPKVALSKELGTLYCIIIGKVFFGWKPWYIII